MWTYSHSRMCGVTLQTDGTVIRVWRVWHDGPAHVVVQNGVIVWGPSHAGESAALHASVQFYDHPLEVDVLEKRRAHQSNGYRVAFEQWQARRHNRNAA